MARHGGETGFGRAAAGADRGDLRPVARELGTDHAFEEVVARGVVVLQVAEHEPDPSRDLTQDEAVETFAYEDGARGGEDLGPPDLSLAGHAASVGG